MKIVTKKLIPQKKGNKYGFANGSGTLVVPYVYDEIGTWSEGLIFVKRERWTGFLNENGDEIIDLHGFMWEQTPVFEDGLCVLIQSGLSANYKFGCIDKNRHIVIPFLYDSCRYLGHRLWLAKKPNYKGLIAYNREIANLSQYEVSEDSYHSGLLGIAKEGRYGLLYWGCIDTMGRVVVPLSYESICIQKSCPVVIAKRQDKYCVVSSTGRELTTPIYDEIRMFNNGVSFVLQNGRWGVIDERGRCVVPPQYIEVKDFVDFRASVKDTSGQWGIIDTQGRIILTCQYMNIGVFNEGLCPVQKIGIVNSKWGFVDLNGKLVIPCNFAEVKSFMGGTCEVKRTGPVWGNDNPWGVINKKGEFVRPWDDNTVKIATTNIGNGIRIISKLFGAG